MGVIFTIYLVSHFSQIVLLAILLFKMVPRRHSWAQASAAGCTMCICRVLLRLESQSCWLWVQWINNIKMSLYKTHLKRGHVFTGGWEPHDQRAAASQSHVSPRAGARCLVIQSLHRIRTVTQGPSKMCGKTEWNNFSVWKNLPLFFHNMYYPWPLYILFDIFGHPLLGSF